MASPFLSLPAMMNRYYVPGFLAAGRFDNEAALRAYEGPVLILHGENDDIVPIAHARRLVRATENRAQLIVLSPDDHDVPWDWNTFAATLTQFYTETGIIAASDDR